MTRRSQPWRVSLEQREYHVQIVLRGSKFVMFKEIVRRAGGENSTEEQLEEEAGATQ
jgi:hypothetical protein